MKLLKHLKKGLAFLIAAVLILSVFPISPKTVHAAGGVNIPDDALRAAITKELKLSEGAEITSEQLASLTTLYVGAPVYNLTGIEYCTALGSLKLTLPSDIALDLTFLGNLPALESLTLYSGKVSDFPQIQGINELYTSGCEILNPASISNLNNLEKLDCYETAIAKLPDCSGMNSLKRLEVKSTYALTDISGISGCSSLISVDLNHCYKLTDISPLSGLSLQNLNLQFVEITAENEKSYMDTISSLSALTYLILSYTGLEDKHTSMFDNLHSLEKLNVSYNELTNADFLRCHTDTLKEVAIHNNPISDSTPLGELRKLTGVSVDGTNITDFSFISKLPELNGKSMWNTEWTETSPAKPRVSIEGSYDKSMNDYVLQNPFKDADGNLIAPKESDEYSYNAATGEITVPTNDQSTISKRIEFPCTFTTQTGKTLKAQPYIDLELTKLLEIITQPQNVSITEGDSATLEVEASGSGTLSYQWYKGDNAISGATKSSLALNNVALSAAGSYTVKVTDENDSVTSDPAVVTVTAIAIPLKITKQPQNVSITEGDSAILEVEASGSGTLSYQWYKDDAAIPGATESSLALNNVALSASGSYTVKVTDTNGNSETSAPAEVTVTAAAIPLKITEQPQNVSITEGESATLEVEASGSGTLSYQWYKGDAAIPGATSATLTISNATLENAGSYTVVVTDENDSKTSAPAVVTVTAIQLVITTQPQNISITEGENATLEVVASGSGTLSYQWFKNNTAISGEITSALTIINAALSAAGNYTVVITDANGSSVTSNTAVVTVTPIQLVITTQPVGADITEGDSATLTVSASGSGTLSYQWYKDDKAIISAEGRAISGATSSTLTISNATLEDAGSYTVKVTDANGSSATSAPAVVTVTAIPLVITTQPQNISIKEGENATLTVSASGSGTLSYQWYKGDTAISGTEGRAISGATSSTLTISNAALEDAGSYTVKVTDQNGSSATSAPAVVTVTAIPLVITTQPQNISIKEGENATLTVSASGSGTLSYQWYKGDTAISGAASSSLDLNNVALSDAGSYTVVVTDKNGSVTSERAVVTINAIPLEITTQPVGADITEGEDVTLTVVASGSGALSYQWFKNNTAISGAITSAHTIINAALSDAGEYHVVVTDKNGNITSAPAVVTVTPIPLEITAQPQNISIKEGESATLTVSASGSGALSYQWYKDDKAIISAKSRAIGGAASSTLTISNAALEDAGSYTVKVTDKNGSITSDPIVVTVTKKETPTETEAPSETEEPTETETEAPVQPKAPLTGDSFSWINYIVLFLSAMTTLICLAGQKREEL